jgi:hypothetical protein
MPNRHICTVGQLVNFLRPLQRDLIVKVDEHEIEVVDNNNEIVAVITPHYYRIKENGIYRGSSKE